MTLNDGQKKRCHSSRENCWRSVEKSKDFGQSRSGFKVKLCVCVCTKKEGGGEERVEKKTRVRRGERKRKKVEEGHFSR